MSSDPDHGTAGGPVDADGALLGRFGSFLSIEKGLAPETVRSYVSLVCPFVAMHAERPGGWASLAAADVDEFLVAQAAIERPSSVCVRANALRSLLHWMCSSAWLPRHFPTQWDA